ncbi:hypothetical protein EYF80_045819 [Liparis tanakae]|uniref:Uncharacterized protein n=1 Tax=Liparis tanakae TaxID=230148 RepID=A0A4Z2FSK8_9TELE|nr:hypothetical protein EYF80_045819 [Liparis tanakae]
MLGELKEKRKRKATEPADSRQAYATSFTNITDTKGALVEFMGQRHDGGREGIPGQGPREMQEEGEKKGERWRQEEGGGGRRRKEFQFRPPRLRIYGPDRRTHRVSLLRQTLALMPLCQIKNAARSQVKAVQQPVSEQPCLNTDLLPAARRSGKQREPKNGAGTREKIAAKKSKPKDASGDE